MYVHVVPHILPQKKVILPVVNNIVCDTKKKHRMIYFLRYQLSPFAIHYQVALIVSLFINCFTPGPTYVGCPPNGASCFYALTIITLDDDDDDDDE